MLLLCQIDTDTWLPVKLGPSHRERYRHKRMGDMWSTLFVISIIIIIISVVFVFVVVIIIAHHPPSLCGRAKIEAANDSRCSRTRIPTIQFPLFRLTKMISVYWHMNTFTPCRSLSFDLAKATTRSSLISIESIARAHTIWTDPVVIRRETDSQTDKQTNLFTYTHAQQHL